MKDNITWYDVWGSDISKIRLLLSDLREKERKRIQTYKSPAPFTIEQFRSIYNIPPVFAANITSYCNALVADDKLKRNDYSHITVKGNKRVHSYQFIFNEDELLVIDNDHGNGSNNDNNALALYTTQQLQDELARRKSIIEIGDTVTINKIRYTVIQIQTIHSVDYVWGRAAYAVNEEVAYRFARSQCTKELCSNNNNNN